jgi:leucyl-tRNA synthetase
MDTFVDSSWYFLRYCSPKEGNLPFEKTAAQYWMPVDQYIGGIEHACMHLIYARFFTKALRDMGLLKFDEPFARLLCQGMVIKDGAKMSKSVGNVVDPMEIIKKYGSDTARLFILFAALPEKELDWSDKGVEGSYRFLSRIARLVEGNIEGKHTNSTNREKRIIGKLNSTIKNVTDHIEKFQLSLAIGALMEFTNDLYKYKSGEINKEVYDECCKTLALLVSPFAPHLAEELWQLLGEKGFISLQKWPKYDEKKIDKKADALEEMIHSTISDIKAVQELTKMKKTKKITIIISSSWKYEFFKEMRKQLQKSFNTGEIIKGLMKDEKLKKQGKLIANLVPKLVKDPARVPETVLDQKTEMQNFEDSREFFEAEFKAKVEITSEDKSREKKAGSAMPGKPAIVLE